MVQAEVVGIDACKKLETLFAIQPFLFFSITCIRDQVTNYNSGNMEQMYNSTFLIHFFSFVTPLGSEHLNQQVLESSLY